MIERHVPSAETCLRLWESGFLQETEYYWWRHGMDDYTLITHQKLQTYRLLRWVQDWYAAPILTEILEQLPANIVTIWRQEPKQWMVQPYDDILKAWVAPASTEAAAQLWLKMKEVDD